MLVNSLLRRQRHDDDGAVLVTVVVVMLVGFVIATMIAASVLFTIGSNSTNRDRTQAFIAAESGRDFAAASIRSKIKTTLDGKKIQVDCIADPPPMTGGGTAPNFEYKVWTTTTAGTDPRAVPSANWTTACPTALTQWVKIESTGWQVDSDKTTVDSYYRWTDNPSNTPSGTVAFFEGQFTATKTTYTGDLVIREGPYECNNGASGGIQGDLWVLRGTMTVTDTCIVTGSVYVRDQISVGNKQLKVGGDLISVQGMIKLNGNGVEVGGDVYAAGDIDTKTGSGVVKGSFKTPGSVTNHVPTDWKNGAPPAVNTPVDDNAAPPVIAPTLEQVYDATRWIELTSTTTWSSVAMPVDAPPAGSVCTTTQIQNQLKVSGTRVVIDMTGCPLTGSAIQVDPGSVTVARDAVILVPANRKMDLHLSGIISRPAGTTLQNGPQLLIVHLDPNGSDNKPPSCSNSDLDKFTAGTTNSVRTLIYSACGIGSTMSLTMSGQLYMGSDGLHLNGGTFTCVPMSWAPTLPTISCGIKGSGGIFDPENRVQRLEALAYQSEQ